VDEDLSLTSATTVHSSNPTSAKEAAALYTGAQQWQRYWAHDATISPATTVQSSAASSIRESTAISTGTQQWQAYWDHDAANPEVQADVAKFAPSAKAFAMPQRLTSATIILVEWLVKVDPQHKIEDQDTKEPSTAAIVAMCDVIGRVFPQDKIRENIGDLWTAITTTCKTLAQLYPQHKIQERGVTSLNKRVIVKIIDFFSKLNETQTLDAGTIRKEIFMNLMASVGRLNKIMIHDAGTSTEGSIFNITALRGEATHRKIENRTESQNGTRASPTVIPPRTSTAAFTSRHGTGSKRIRSSVRRAIGTGNSVLLLEAGSRLSTLSGASLSFFGIVENVENRDFRGRSLPIWDLILKFTGNTPPEPAEPVPQPYEPLNPDAILGHDMHESDEPLPFENAQQPKGLEQPETSAAVPKRSEWEY
jgi:hypothetical protein